MHCWGRKQDARKGAKASGSGSNTCAGLALDQLAAQEQGRGELVRRVTCDKRADPADGFFTDRDIGHGVGGQRRVQQAADAGVVVAADNTDVLRDAQIATQGVLVDGSRNPVVGRNDGTRTGFEPVPRFQKKEGMQSRTCADGFQLLTIIHS